MQNLCQEEHCFGKVCNFMQIEKKKNLIFCCSLLADEIAGTCHSAIMFVLLLG